MSVVRASILSLTEAEMAEHVKGCNAVASCLGHNSECGRDLKEPISPAQKCVIGLLRQLLPPHMGNEKAADYLRIKIGQNDNAIEWAAVRPDSLVDEGAAAEYDVHPSPVGSAIFDAGVTRRINVGHFMAALITDDDTPIETWSPGSGVVFRSMLATLLRFAFVPVFVLMGTRLFWLIDAYSVDLLFLDHWDYFEGLFSDASLLDLFRWQHGPHRQGVGFLLTKVIAELTGWNLRAEAFVLGAVVCTACALALLLKRRIVGPFRWSDVAIPLALLTPLQFATFINTPNAAHSALPLLLLLTMALAWEIRRPLTRYTTLIALDVAVVHTGFGFFAGLVLPGLFLLEVARNRASPESPDFLRPLAAFGVSLGVLALFFVGYAASEATSISGVMVEEWWSYPRFMAISVSRLFWMRGGRAEPVGFAILALSVWALIFHARLLLKQPEQAPRSRAVVFFLAFALLFVAAISVGRMPLGLRAGTASRYMTLLTLLYLGLYLGSFSISPFLREYTLYGAVAFLVYGSVPLRDATVERMEYFHDAKVRWRDTYLTTRETEAAHHASPLPAYPRPSDPRFRERLRYLEANRLSFFRENGAP